MLNTKVSHRLSKEFDLLQKVPKCFLSISSYLNGALANNNQKKKKPIILLKSHIITMVCKNFGSILTYKFLLAKLLQNSVKIVPFFFGRGSFKKKLTDVFLLKEQLPLL